MGIEQTHTVTQMETPHSPVGSFELPCGYLDPETKELHREVTVREMSGREEDMLASKKTPNALKLNNLLTSCVTRIGPYEGNRLAHVVQSLPIGDRVFLLFAIRRVTLGDELPVREVCPNCDTKSLYMVDLESELTIKPMPDPYTRIYDRTLPRSQKVARFRVSTGADELAIAKLQQSKRGDEVSQSIMMRLELLGDQPPTLKAIQDLSLVDRQFLKSAFDEVEGGVDTDIDFECASCGHEWRKPLNVGSQGFFSPSAMLKA